MSQKEILDEYDKQNELYESFASKLYDLIEECLDAGSITVHSIEGRVKDRVSLEKKLSEKYNALTDITDIAGIRIITHYSDSVDIIASLIENEFSIDKENSTDKRKLLDPDRFGYLSLHYVISFKDERTSLTEYKKFKGLKAEIQIRSILQHTWAEIEHDIGYKSKTDVPDKVKRQFSRLAGLLEIADEEFVGIRKSISSYKDDVEKEMISAPENVALDAVSLREFINSNKLIRDIEGIVIKEYDLELIDISTSFLSIYLKYLEYHKVQTIAELTSLIELNKNKLIERYKNYEFGDSDEDVTEKTIFKGNAIFHLSCILSAKNGNFDEVMEYLNIMGIGIEGNDRSEFAEYLLKFKD